jgi:hypothetical protein
MSDGDLQHFFRVSNVKFNVAKVLQSLIPIVDQSVSAYLLVSVGMNMKG